MAKPFKRKDGRWSGYVTIPGTGKRKYVYADTEREVRRELVKLQYEIDEGIYTGKDSVAFESLLNTWYDIHKTKVAESTQQLYRMYLDVHIIPKLGSLKLREVTGLKLDQYYNSKLEDGLSPNTVRKLHSLLRQAFKYAMKNGVISVNPIEAASPPSQKKTKVRICTEKEFDMIMSHVSGTRNVVPIVLAGAVGLRRGEILGLKWENVDFKNKTITIEESMTEFLKVKISAPKTESSHRTIKVFDFVIDILEAYKKSSDSDPMMVFNHYQPKAWSEKFRHIVQEIGLDGLRFHDLRHYNATLMLKYGVPDIVAAERLGHSDTSMLKKVYQHVLDEMRDEAAQKLNDAFGSDSSNYVVDIEKYRKKA